MSHLCGYLFRVFDFACHGSETFKLVDLFGHASAEAMEDGTNAAHERKDAPEERPSEDVGDDRLRMGEKEYPPGDQVGAGYDTDVAEHESPDS